MGRTSIAKQRKIEQLRNQGFTQQEIVKKMNLDIRTVRKYDPLRKQKPDILTEGKIKEINEACDGLIALGLVCEDNDGRIYISDFGKKVRVRWDELTTITTKGLFHDCPTFFPSSICHVVAGRS